MCSYMSISLCFPVWYQCTELDEDGFCAENRNGVNVLTRAVGQASEEVLEKARDLAKKLCFQPGDFVALEHGQLSPIISP